MSTDGRGPHPAPRVPRRTFLLVTGAAGAAACAPNVSAPVPGATTAAPTKAAWETQWNQLVAAAKAEGKLVVNNIFNKGNPRKALDAFEQAFPGISVEQTTFASQSLWVPKVLQEQQAKIFSWDVAILAGATAVPGLRDQQALEPLPPALFRPDVTPDKNWRGGFAGGFIEKEKRWGYAMGLSLGGNLWINTDLVKEDEVRTVQDLLNPRWKGKLLLNDVRSGYTATLAAPIRLLLGEEVLKRLMVDQQPVYTRDNRLITENMVRGKHPIATGVVPSILDEFLAQGLGKNVKPVFLSDTLTGVLESVLIRMRGAPHPNAAQLFVNWVLTKEGQVAIATSTDGNSRRLDVPPVNQVFHAGPDRPLRWTYGSEETVQEVIATQKLVQGWLGE